MYFVVLTLLVTYNTGEPRKAQCTLSTTNSTSISQQQQNGTNGSLRRDLSQALSKFFLLLFSYFVVLTLLVTYNTREPRKVQETLMFLGHRYFFLFSLFFLITKFLDANTTTHYHVHHQPHINKSTTMERHHVVNTQLPPTPEMMKSP